MTTSGDEPITAGSLLDYAIADLDLPARAGDAVDTWVERLSGDRAKHHGRELAAAVRRADFKTAREQAVQAETSHLADQGKPKVAGRV